MKDAEVHRIEECRLRLSSNAWGFAESNEKEIAQHWRERKRDNPSFFNGRILVMECFHISHDVLEARFMETDFANFLYWKDSGYPESGAIDGFGTVVIRARGGEVLLARQKAGNVNAGLVYLPGGFIDPRDVTTNGIIDIDASVLRELEEETGLPASEFTRRPGYLITIVPPQISIAVELVSELEANELRRVLNDKIAAQADPELEDFIVFAVPPTPGDEDVAVFSRCALSALFSETSLVR